MILLPGMDGTGSLFEQFIKPLPVGVRTKVVSYPNETHLSYQELEDLVAHQLPVAEKYPIVAESFSGPIAIRLAGRPSGDLSANVLISSFAYLPLGWAGRLIAMLPLSLIFRWPLPKFVLKMFLLDKSASEDLVRSVVKAIKQVKPAVLAGRLRDALTSDYCRQPISSPSQIPAICASTDRLLGKRAKESIARVCPMAEILNVTSPHLMLQTAPQQVLDLLNGRNVLLPK